MPPSINDRYHGSVAAARFLALLGVLSALLPATYLAANSRFDTIAVKFEGTVLRDPVIVQAGGG